MPSLLECLSPEDRALAACAARVVNPSLPLPSGRNLDATRLLASARRHRMVPLLSTIESLPRDARSVIEEESNLSVARSLQFTAALTSLWPKFQTHGMTVVPVKG